MMVVDSERMPLYQRDHLDLRLPLLASVVRYVAGPKLLLEYLVAERQGTQD